MGFLTGAIDANTRFADGDIRKVESRFSPENLPHSLKLVELVKAWAERKRATPAQIALAWLMAQKPWIVPIPGTTQMAHMLENIGAATVRFTPPELAELNASVSAIKIEGARLPEPVPCWPSRAWRPLRRTDVRSEPGNAGRLDGAPLYELAGPPGCRCRLMLDRGGLQRRHRRSRSRQTGRGRSRPRPPSTRSHE